MIDPETAKILLVDDSPLQIDVLQGLLERAGYPTVISTTEAQEAVDLARREGPDVIFLDMVMPGRDGLEILSELRADEELAHIPVLIITMLEDAQAKIRALELGATDYLRKPVVQYELIARLRNALAIKAFHDDAKDRAKKLESEVSSRTADLLESNAKLKAEVRARQTAQELLSESEGRLHAITASAPDAIIMIDDCGFIVFWNEAATRIFGYTEHEALGRNAHELLAPSRYLNQYREAAYGFQKTGQGKAVGKTVQLNALRKGGAEFPIELSLSSVNQDGRWHAIAIVRDVTQRRQREDELLRIRQALDNATDAIAVVGTDGTIKYQNTACVNLFGYTSGEIDATGGPPAMFCDPDLERELMHLAEQGESWRGEVDIRAHDGQVIPVLLRGSPILDAEGNVIGLLEVLTDIRDRRRREQAKRLDEARLEALLQLGNMGRATMREIADFALERAVTLTGSRIGYLAFLNEDETVLTMHAWSESAMQQCSIADRAIVYPIENTGLWGEAVRQRKPVITNDYAAPNTLKRGLSEGHVEIVCHMNVPVFDGERIVAVAGVGNKGDDYDESDVRQLTLLMQGMWGLLERKRKQDALTKSEQKYRALAEQTNDLPYSVDRQGTITYIGPQVHRYGFIPAELISRNFLEFVVAEDRERMAADFLRAVTTGEESANEFRITGKDGSVHWMEDRGKVQYDGSGEITAVAGVLRDVGERKRMEEALRASEQRLREREELLRAILESTADGMLVTDEKQRITHTNKRFVDMWHIPDDLLQTKDDDKLLKYVLSQLVDPETFLRKVVELRANGKEDFDIIVFKDGRFFERLSCPLIQGREIRGRVWSFRDVTARKQAEEALRRKEEEFRQSQRMEAVGQLAGGIAHEFNNLLQAIGGYTKYAMEGLPVDGQRYQDLRQVCQATERAATLTRQLLGFSRRQTMERRNVDPNQLIVDLAKMIRPVIGEHIDLRVNSDDHAGTLYADPGELQQALLNLCLNARDVMPSGGRLILRTEAVVLSEDFCEFDSQLAPGRYVVFSVADTGCGMSREVKQRIFEPFYTTKEVGKGTGLGLAQVYGVVQQHGGTIHVYSEPGRGTTFKVYLPSVNTTPDAESEQAVSYAPGGSETILVAEDDPMACDLARRILITAGYSVMVASNGEEALQLFRANRDKISLLLLDVLMPKLSGHEVYRRVKEENADIEAVFCTGYDPETARSDVLSENNLPLVEKPFNPEKLLRTIREVLDVKEECAVA
jgi:PAS domain S-box-containing protein